MPAQSSTVPSYLADFSDLYGRDPHQAALAWFAEARFGLFMHYGLYSILGRGEWVMFQEAIPVAQYEQLVAQFHPDRFDADFITDLALEAGMKYVTVTTRHHDSFCLFDTKVSTYNSVQSPARRDLIGELTEQCARKRLGFFMYYSYSLDWRHPYFYPRSDFQMARPDYATPEPSYKFRRDTDFQHYVTFMHAQLGELLTNYGPVAGIWFDPIMGYYARSDLFPIHETYAMIRQLQPQALICFKQGATGAEDFAAPERHGYSLAQRCREMIGESAAEVAQVAWDGNKNKHNEICDTLQPGAWGYRRDDDAQHHTPDEVLGMLDAAASQRCNLLLNTGPLPDGSIHPEDAATLREVGRRLRS